MQTAQHILDNPVWNALISGNKAFAQGTETVKFFPREVVPFVAFEEETPAHFDELYDIMAIDTPVLLFTVNDLKIPESWSVLIEIPGYQMVYNGSPLPELQYDEIVPLTVEHVPQILELIKLTNPGPVFSRTIEFGNYEGIFKDGQLVAMTGQRLHPYGYIEVSAVCTHPDYSGRGYAKQLVLRQTRHILESACIPFLHVRRDNSRAISVYNSLGFEIRKDVTFIVIQKKG